MRYLAILAMLLATAAAYAQGSGFTFSYTGPTQILVGPECEEPLEWGHPNTPTASSNLPGGMIVSFEIWSISGGYQIGDLVPGGTTVTVFYQAVDNFGNNALFGFNIAFVDLLPPVFDPFSLPPGMVTVNCLDQVPPPADVEASDNCENDNTNLTITFTETNNAQLCTGGTITRQWVADDDLGNFATFIQTIHVTPDMTPPVIANNLQNGMAPCSTAMAQYSTWLTAQRANFSATDSGCGLEGLADNAPSPALITSFCGPIDVTFTATDVCGNASTVLRTFTVFNDVPPVITQPAADASGNCGQANIQTIFDNWIQSHGGATAEDDCSSIFWTTFPPQPTIFDTCDASITVMFIAGDGCNNFDTTMASFVLTDDTPPVIGTQASTQLLSCTTAQLDSLLTEWLLDAGTSTATDLCTRPEDLQLDYVLNGNVLTLEGVLQAWQDSLSAGCRDGVIINGIGINNVLAVLPVSFQWTDNCANSAMTTGYFGITDNGRPAFSAPPQDTSFACAEGMNWEPFFMSWYQSAGFATYADACSDVSVTASITADSAMTYLAAALDTACDQGVSVQIAFTLTDDCGNVSLTSPSASFALSDTLAPVLITPASDITLSCGGDPQAELETWLDTLGGIEAGDGCGSLTWMFTWNDTSGVMTGIPGTGPYPDITSAGCNALLTIAFIAEDPCLNTLTDTAVATLIDTIPPVFSQVADTLLLDCQTPVPGDPPAVMDDCTTMPLLTFQDSTSMDSCTGRPSLIVRTWTATDACGNSATAQITYLTQDTTPPSFDLPPDMPAMCELDSLLLENISDNCDPSPLVTWTDMLEGPACDQLLTRIWMVTDACGNVATASQQIALRDETPPVIATSPGDVLFACSPDMPDLQGAYDAWRASVDVVDGCSASDYFIALAGSFDPTDTMTWPGTPLPDSLMAMCGEGLSVDAELLAFDACGNYTLAAISFVVQDTVPPGFDNCPGQLSFPADAACTAQVVLPFPDVTEICFPDNLLLQYVLNGGDTLDIDAGFILDTLLPVGMHQLEWLATDCAGLVGVCTTDLLVEAESAISATCPADTLAYTTADQCAVTLAILPPTVTTGPCGTGIALLSGYIEGTGTPGEFVFSSQTDSIRIDFPAGTHVVHLIAQDSTGSGDTCRYTVTVLDTLPPDLSCHADTLFISPSGMDTILLADAFSLFTASDACGLDTVVVNAPLVTCDLQGQEIPVMITATDHFGNSSTCETTVYITTTPLVPIWSRGLCDDTLRLFAMIPGDPPVGYDIAWSGPGGFMSSEENPVIPEADSTYSGTYTVTITGPTGCTSTGTLTVTIASLNAPVLTVGADTICAGDTIRLMANEFAGDITYGWYWQRMTGDTLLGMTSEPAFSIGGFGPGEYAFYADAVQDTCSSGPGNPVSVFIAPRPVAGIGNVPAVLCMPDTLFLTPAVIVDTLMYTWTGPGGYMSGLPAPAGIPASEIDSVATFVLTVSNALCTSDPDSVTLTVQPTPATPVIQGDTLACEGGQFSLFTTVPADQFQWIGPSGQVLTTDTGALMVSPAMFAQAGLWRVLAIANGCPGDTSAGFEVAIDSGIVIDIVIPVQVCAGDSITLAFSPPADGEVTWTGPGGFISDEISPTVLAEAGAYAVALLTSTGCMSTDEQEVQVDVRPEAIAISTQTDTCVDGLTPIILTASSEPPFGPGFMYTWTGPGTYTAMDASITLDDMTAGAAGLYSVFIVNGACTSDTAIFDLVLQDSPAPPAITGDDTYCDGDTIILSIDTPLTGGTYTWTFADSSRVVDHPGTLVIPNVNAQWSGSYSVSVGIQGCQSGISEIAITVLDPLPPATVDAPSLICEGDSLILATDLPVGAEIHWSGPNGFESDEDSPVIFPFSPDNAGAYVITYTLSGCPAPLSDPFAIGIQEMINAPTISASAAGICLDAPVAIEVCLVPGTGTPGAQYTLWVGDSIVLAGPSSDSCLNVSGQSLQPGINLLTVTAALNGCVSGVGEALVLQADTFPDNAAQAGLPQTLCPQEVILLDASDPAPGTGMWTSDAPEVVFTDPANPMTEVNGLPPGSYTLQWSHSYASCGVYSTDTLVLDILQPPIAVPDTVEVPFGRTEEFVVTLNDMLFLQPFTLRIVTPPQRGNALHVGNGIFRYSPNVGFVGTDMMTYEICATDCPSECSEVVVLIRVGDEDDCFVPTLFTPNGDGINDLLIIPCLESTRFPDNRIVIFNEWGGLVYEASPYLNDWDGRADGQDLPVGTYFYIMDFQDGNAPKRTFLVLER